MSLDLLEETPVHSILGLPLAYDITISLTYLYFLPYPEERTKSEVHK